MIAFLLLAPQIGEVATGLVPDYVEVTYGQGSGSIDNNRVGPWEEDRTFISGTLGWFLTAKETSEEEKAAWRAIRAANLQRDELIEVHARNVAVLEQLVDVQEEQLAAENAAAQLQAALDAIDHRGSSRAEEEKSWAPLVGIISSLIALLGVLIRGESTVRRAE